MAYSVAKEAADGKPDSDSDSGPAPINGRSPAQA